MEERLYLYPLWLRSWHWVNVVLFLILIITGLSLQYSNPDYLMIRFDKAVSFHNLSGILMTVNFIVFLLSNQLTSNKKYYKFNKKKIYKRLLKQFRFYTYGLFKHEQPPFPVTKKRKFNPMQKMSYLVVMYFLMPIVIISGFGLLYPEINIPNVFGTSGIHITDLVHITSGFLLSIFMVIHVYFCTIGAKPISNFKSMITGWHGGK